MLKIGEVVFEKYRVLKLLGQGGMGRVYLAENINVGNMWAIKEIDFTAGNPVVLLAEPEILKKLKHPNLPRIVDVIRAPTSIYIIEDYFEGQSLKGLIENNRQLCTEKNVVKWATQLAEILIYLHGLKPSPIIYRDLKPANIIIDENSDLKLVDFGIAVEHTEGARQSIALSRGYAAPEQYRGRFDERSDIYGFGATFFHVLTGIKYNFEKPVTLKQVNQRFSEGMNHILDKCLRVDPKQRYQNAADLFKDLKSIERFSAEYKRKKLKQKLAVAAILGALALGVFAIQLGFEQKELTDEQLYQERIEAGVNLTAKGRYDEAEKAFNEALKYKHDPEVYHNLAKMYLQKNDPRSAIDLLINQNQTGELQDVYALYLLGSAYFSLEDYPNAIIYFQKSIEAGPSSLGNNYENAMRDLAVSYGRLGRYSEAEDILNTLIRQKGSASHVVSYILGELSREQGSYPEALRHFEAALAGDPRNLTYIRGAAALYGLLSTNASSQQDKEGWLKKAVAILKKGEAVDPHHIQIVNDYGKYCYDLGELYQATGNNASIAMYQEALTAFSKLETIGFISSNTYVNIALVNDKLDNREAAEKAFQQALKVDEGDSHANFMYGLFKIKRKQYEEAHKYLQKVVDLNKNQEEVSVARARIAELREKGWIQ
ncbi:MAG: tetratricopeptide repeat protein [Bacillota bacterium]